MNVNVPRLRMFAGPNGSGKSTFKIMIRRELLGIYINPDEIEKEMRDCGFLNLKPYQVITTHQEISAFFQHSSLLKKFDEAALEFDDNKLSFHNGEVNAYFASVTADFLRQKLTENLRSFTFETVMSFSDKVELLQKARSKGYRTYLYYVATENPDINISRVRYRISRGGHSVPEDKIVTRYYRSLDLLMQAVQHTDRAYIFDNSTHGHIWLAEITNGQFLEMKTNKMPIWFKKALWDKFNVC